jgi:hypothetical protein
MNPRHTEVAHRRHRQALEKTPTTHPRANWWLAAVFISAAAGFVLHGLRTNTRVAEQLGGIWRLQSTDPAATPVDGGHVPDAIGQPGGSTSAAGGARITAGDSDSAEVEPVASPEERDAELIARAVSARDPVMRAEAVNQLSRAETPMGIVALGDVARSDPSPQIRIEAINSLRVLFVNDSDADGAIRAILLKASGDRDPAVAAHAREVYREVIELVPQA